MSLDGELVWPIRVYYEDTDSGGVVYHSNYMNFMERARTEWLRARGVEQDQLRKEFGVLFAVCEVNIKYLKPAKFNQLLNATVKLIHKGKASIKFEQTIVEHKEPHTVYCTAIVKVACLDAETLRPHLMPQKTRMEIFGER